MLEQLYSTRMKWILGSLLSLSLVTLGGPRAFAKASTRKRQAQCEVRLVPVSKTLYLSQRAQRNVAHLRITEEELDGIVHADPSEFMSGRGSNDYYYYTFLNHDGIDRGYRIGVHRTPSRYFVIDSIEQTKLNEEKSYFKQMAHLRGLGWARLRLSHSVLGRWFVKVAPGVQLKLELKHQIDLDLVKRAFARSILELRQEDHQFYAMRGDRYSLIVRVAADQLMRLVVSPMDDGQSLFLVTAFPESSH